MRDSHSMPDPQSTPDSIDAARRRLRWQLGALGVVLVLAAMFAIPWQLRSTPVRGASGRVHHQLGTARATWLGAPALAWTYRVDSASFATLRRDWADVLPLATAAAERQGMDVVVINARAIRRQAGLLQQFDEVSAAAKRVKGQWTSGIDDPAVR